MKIMSHKNSELGFTLVEMLAALVAAVVIIGAATGFMLTAAIRQLKVLGANALEAQHESLAETMSVSIQSATAFQIYAAEPGIKFDSSLAPGEPEGNFLVCRRPSLVEEFALVGNQISIRSFMVAIRERDILTMWPRRVTRRFSIQTLALSKLTGT